MLPQRPPRAADFCVAALTLLWLTLPGALTAQSLLSVAPQQCVWRAGDDLAWAAPNLDDHSWSVAQQGTWPRPAFSSDGFIWVRFRVPVRTDTAEPLALRITTLSRIWMAEEVFVNGTHVGNFGRVPPGSFVSGLPLDTVFVLPSNLTHPGTVAHIALRIWYPPFARQPGGQKASASSDTGLQSGGSTAIETGKRQPGGFDAELFTFDQVRTLHAEIAASRAQARLRNTLPATLNVLILLIGLAILLVGRSSRSRDLCLYGAMLASLPWITLFFECMDSRLLNLSEAHCVWFQVVSQLPAMVITIELIWRINGFRDVWFKRLTYASMVLFNVGALIAFTPSEPSNLVAFSLIGYRVSLQAFNILTLLANLWVIFARRQRRLIAFAMLLVPSASLIEGFRNTAQSADLFDLAFFLAGFCLTAILAHQAWKEWRVRDALQAEFETAREMQQQLVTPVVHVPGFRIESVYKPANHVGGDFFYIRAEGENAVLLVIGDVSGKGLKAAMTVNLVIGALRTMPLLPLTRILAALNNGLVGQMQGGFVTCCVVRIDQNGAVAIANAGHLSPYLDGTEVPVNTGLPLGIDAGVEFEEKQFILDGGSRLTFLSDGVVEARNAAGELFGFERTAAIATNAAEEIAQAAQVFGQEDDITVLTLQYAPAEVLHA